LPPGLGPFSLRHIDDYSKRVPEQWLKRGGVLMPMYQAEAMRLSFGTGFDGSYPFVLKVATGKINAVTGAPWSQPLRRDPQDYLVLPASLRAMGSSSLAPSMRRSTRLKSALRTGNPMPGTALELDRRDPRRSRHGRVGQLRFCHRIPRCLR
jgi:hypothetical protein